MKVPDDVVDYVRICKEDKISYCHMVQLIKDRFHLEYDKAVEYISKLI